MIFRTLSIWAYFLTMMLTACHSSDAQHGLGTRAHAQKPAPTNKKTEAKKDVPWFKAQRSLMGTIFEISVAEAHTSEKEAALKQALDEIARLETLLSEWQSTSEISKVNQNAGVRPVKVGPEMMDVVRTGMQVSDLSQGAHDLSWAALHGLYLFTPGDVRIPTMAQIKQRLPLINYHNIIVDEKASTIFLKKKGMAIGMGGIAKGYALDRAAAILHKAGLKDFTIFGGGQVFVSGKRGDRPWRVGIQHPRKRDFIAYAELTSGSIATSGDYEHYVEKDGKLWHHIINPRTGLPATDVMSVTVISESALYADAIDTAIFVMGPQKGLQMLKKTPVKVEAVIIDKDLKLHATPGTLDKLVFHPPYTADNLNAGDTH